MFALPDRLVGAPARRRGDTQGSTGLDYTTCHRVEDDIFTRIRSLITSRGSHLPSPALTPSEETSAGITDYDIVEMFDFTTARSVAHLARVASGRLSTSDIEVYEQVEGSVVKLSKRWTLRSNGSMSDLEPSDRLRSQRTTNGMGQVLDDVASHDTLLTCCPPCPPVERGVELPRLVLRGKDSSLEKAPVIAAPNKAVESVVQRFDETCTEEAELICDPRCSIDEGNELVLDIPKFNWNPTEVLRPHCDFRATAPSTPNPGSRLKGAIKPPEPTSEGTSCPYERVPGPSPGPSSLHLPNISRPGILCDASELSKTRGKTPLHSTSIPLQRGSTSSIGQTDNSDLKDTPLEASISSPLSSPTSLHQPITPTETRPSLVSGSWPSSNSSPRASVHTSLLSGASRSSANRHALLKPSVTTSHSIDLGLPIQPVLTPLAVNMEAEASQDTNSAVNDGHKPALPSPLLSTDTLSRPPTNKETVLRNIAQRNPLLDNGNHIATKIGHNDTGLDELAIRIGSAVALSSRISGVTDEISSNVNEGDPGLMAGETVVEKSRGAVGITTGPTPIDTPFALAMVGIDPGSGHDVPRESATAINTAYWGFTPPISEAVDVAIYDVVERAVEGIAHDLVIPSGFQSDQASATYRGTVKETMSDAVQTCDEHLRRSSSPIGYSTPSHKDINSNHASIDLPPKHLKKTWPMGKRTPVSNLFSEGMEGSSPASEDITGALSSSVYGPEGEIRSSILESSSNTNYMPTSPGELERRDDLYSMVSVALSHPVQADPVQREYSETGQPVWGPTHQEEALCSGIASSRCGTIPSKNTSHCEVSLGNYYPKHPEGGRASMKDRGSAAPLQPFQQLNPTHPESSTSTAMSPKKTDAPNGFAIVSDSKLAELNRTKSAVIDKSERRRAVQRLQGLISNTEPYAPQLTALPSRPQLDLESPIRTSDAPRALCKPTGQACFDFFPKPKAELKETQVLQASETLTRSINDLENLLSEALYIAHKATEGDTVHSPARLGDASVLPRKDGGIHSHSMKISTDQTRLRRRSVQSNIGLENAHESLLSGSGSSLSMSSGMSREESHDMFYKNGSGPRVSTADRPTTVEPVALSRRNSTRFPRDGGCPPPLRTVEPVPNTAGLWKGSDFGQPPERTTLDKANSGHDVIPAIVESTTDPGLLRVSDVPGIRDENTGSTRRPRSESTNNSSLMTRELYDQKHATAALGRLANIPPTLLHMSISSVSPEANKVVRKISTTNKLYEEDNPNIIKTRTLGKSMPNKREVREFIRVFHQPPIQPRGSSLALRKLENLGGSLGSVTSAVDFLPSRMDQDHTLCSVCSTDGPHDSGSEVDFSKPQVLQRHTVSVRGDAQAAAEAGNIELKDIKGVNDNLPPRHISGRRLQDQIHDKAHRFNLRGKSHISLTSHQHFSLSRSHHRQPIARDWSTTRKRFVATVACINTALIGTLIGIYAGEVPSIQYYIADFYHWALLGNVFMFIGLAISNLLFWPLPLLYGRKPYILTAMTIAMPLLFPQALVVGLQRSPYVIRFRFGLILPRALMGFALGFANMNFMATLTDLFGASLQSGNPHQEVVDEFDVRRHGGGMGVWLGIWTWCYIGSIGVGFLIGALIINTLSPDWGFYVSIVIIAAVLFLNVLTPEVRRSAYRRSVTEVRTDNNVSRRLARGEVKMHLVQTGPIWWGEEFYHGTLLTLDMVRQPGFLLMAFYVAWIYGQIVLIIVLLGSLMSKLYYFRSPAVGATTMAIPIGALLAVPFQKASIFSRARHHAQRTNSMTFEKRVTWTSHLVRRAIFTLVLPFAGLAYTLSSSGPPTPFILPVLFAGLIGFLSNLAIAECNGIIMEAFDTSDLQPGMTGRPRGASGDRTQYKRTNYSSFPRVSSAFAIIHSLGFLIAAGAYGVGGSAQRRLGQVAATGVMAGILLLLTIGVLGVLIRWKEVQIIPDCKTGDMEQWEKQRKSSIRLKEDATRSGDPVTADEEPWRPIIIGNPSGKTRRMSILELGHLTRWSEIRRRNRLINEQELGARHPNLAILASVRDAVKDKNIGSLRRGLSRRNDDSSGDSKSPDLGERARKRSSDYM